MVVKYINAKHHMGISDIYTHVDDKTFAEHLVKHLYNHFRKKKGCCYVCSG